MKQSNSQLSLLVILLFAFLYVPIPLDGQLNGDKYFFAKDFPHNGEVYRITASRDGSGIDFMITKGSQKDSFNMVALNSLPVFTLQLETVFKKFRTDSDEYEPLSSSLNNMLTDLSTKMSDTTFTMTDGLKKSFHSQINKLVQLQGCDAVFAERPAFNTVLENEDHETITSFFENERLFCEDNVIAQEEAEAKSIRQLAGTLYEGIIKNSLVDPNDATKAGSIIVEEKVKIFDCEKDSSAVMEYTNFEDEKLLQEVTSRMLDTHFKKDKGTVVFKADDPDAALLEKLLGAKDKEQKQRDSSLVASIVEASAARVASYLINGNCNLYFDVDSVEFEFENGGLYNVKALGTINGIPQLFENYYPFSFSTKLAINSEDGYNMRSAWGRNKMVINTRDLFKYNYYQSNRNENYAPRDQVVTVKPSRQGVLLYKERTSEILKAKVFTDLVGLDDEQPNGLIQTEFSKPVNLNTKPWGIFGKYQSSYLILLNKMEPTLTFNKIEQDEKSIPITKKGDNSVVTYSDVLRYRKASLGVDVEALQLSIPSLHSIFSVTGGLHYSLITFEQDVENTAANGDTVMIETNSFTNLARDVGFGIHWQINASDKYQFKLSYSPRYMRLFGNDDPQKDIIPVVNLRASDQVDATDRTERYQLFEFLASAQLSDRGDLFLRGRYNFLKNNTNQNFFQIQLGYSFFFFSQN